MIKNKIKSIALFLSSILLGMLIVFNTNLEGLNKNLNLSAVEYKDAVEERTELYEKIGTLKEENEAIKSKIDMYNVGGGKSLNIIEDMKDQTELLTMVTGQRTVTGPGVIIKITDGDVDIQKDTQVEIMSRIFHDNDMALVLNEVRNSGAESIAVNSHRIVGNTGVICNWAFIGFEDNSMESAPFYIYAIGDPDMLQEGLLREGSHINKLIIRKLNVEIEKKDSIVIPASSSTDEIKYMKRYEGN